ncbi:MAG: hypothetical protein SGARI_006901, partial [Bacillariaceae sp.]
MGITLSPSARSGPAEKRRRHHVWCGIVSVMVLVVLRLFDGRSLAVLSPSYPATSLAKASNATNPSLRNAAAVKGLETAAYRRRVVVLQDSFPYHGWNASDSLTQQEISQSFYFDMPPPIQATNYRFQHDKDLTEGCDYMEEWQRQTIARPTCNMLHEVSIRMGSEEPTPHSSAIMEPLGKGSLKQVWSIHDDGFHDGVLLKTSHDMQNSNDADNQYADAKEAMIMDQCTSSRHIVGIYGWCYQSSLIERADGSLLEWVQRHIFYPVRNQKGQILPEIAERIVR